MSDPASLQQALAILRGRDNLLPPDVLATIAAVLEAQADGAVDPAKTLPDPPSERRPVTVLFLEVSGASGGPADDRNPARLHTLWRRLDQIITLHGGTIDKHMGDTVLAVFGVPVAAENDAERAVRCAQACVQLVEVTRDREPLLPGLTARAGLNTGLVSVGTVGSDGSATVIGDMVNVASRLRETATPGSVVLGENTFRLIEPFYEVQPLGPQVIKGRRTPVPAYRVVAARPRQFFTSGRGVEGVTPPMIGRQLELERLRAAITAAAEERRGRLILITGEAGVGKSRLAGELNAWLEVAGPEAVVFQGRGDQRLAGQPFSLLRDLLTGYFGILDSDAPDVAEARLIQALHALRRSPLAISRPELLRQRVRAVARLVGLDLMRPADLTTGTPERSAVAQAQADILSFFELMAANSDAAVVFLEDIHWADADSLDLLEKLGGLTEQTNLVVIALMRPQIYERRPTWRSPAQAPGETIALGPLPPDDSTTLAREILRPLAPAPDDLLDLIVRSAGGNPFYMEELVKVLIGDGIILTEAEGWRLSVEQLDRLRLPDTLAGILQARLDRLPGLERTVLQQAAVVGDEFWDGSVYQLNLAARAPVSREAVTEALRSLEGREMIFRVPLSALAGTQAYQFRHAALREAAYETILLRDRPFYHVAAAEWLEAQSSDRLAEVAAPIAAHYEQAGDRERAAFMYELAGQRAADQQRPGRAAEYYGRALALLLQFPQQIERCLGLYRALGEALLAKGRTAEALRTFSGMAAAAETAGDLLAQARAGLALAAIYRGEGETAEALAAARRAAQVAALTGAAVELAQAEAVVAELSPGAA